MIDWVSCFLPVVHPRLYTGEVIAINADGSIDWKSDRKHQVQGSWSSQLMVKSHDRARDTFDANGMPVAMASHLRIEGNPSKWLQGHNIVGTDNLLELMLDTFDRLCEKLQIKPTDFERQRIKKGDYRLTRIDYNRMYELPTRADVRAWLRAAEFKAKSRHGRPMYNRGTLTFGGKSSHWKIVCYCKADEMQARNVRKAPIEELLLLDDPELKQWVDNKLRVEMRLMSRKLKETPLIRGQFIPARKLDPNFTKFDGSKRSTSIKLDTKIKRESCSFLLPETLQWAYNLTPQVLKDLFTHHVGGLEMSEQIELNSEEVLNLPNKLRGTYMLWKEGHDLKEMLTIGTYYRHRAELKEYGIDIALRCDRAADTSNVIPLIRVLEAKPAAIPAFFFERGLIHRSARANY